MTRTWCIRGGNISQFQPLVPTSGRDCGVAVAADLIRFGMHGLVKPSAGQVRKRMGNLTGWTTPLDVKRAVESYDREARRRGYKPLRYKLGGTWSNGLIVKGASRAGLIARVKRNEMVHLVVDYAVTNDRFPWLSGSTGFRSRHAIWIGAGNKRTPGYRYRKGRLQVRFADPTWGRPGTPSKPPKWVDFATVWAMADGAWSDRGGRGWVGGSVACSPLLPKPAPPEPPEDPCEDVRTELEERVEQLEEQLAEAQAIVDELRARIPDEEVLALLRELRDDIDGLLPLIDDDDTPIEQGMEVPE